MKINPFELDENVNYTVEREREKERAMVAIYFIEFRRSKSNFVRFEGTWRVHDELKEENRSRGKVYIHIHSHT